MPHVVSRINGLKIAIPNDARNVIHRFAIGGGGNELVFNAIRRADFDKSRSSEQAPLDFGAADTGAGPDDADIERVELTLNVAEDGDGDPEAVEEVAEAPAEVEKAAKPKARRRKPVEADDVTL